jgi:hypothetical protein
MTLASASFSRPRSDHFVTRRGCQTVRSINIAISAAIDALHVQQEACFAGDDLNHPELASQLGMSRRFLRRPRHWFTRLSWLGIGGGSTTRKRCVQSLLCNVRSANPPSLELIDQLGNWRTVYPPLYPRSDSSRTIGPAVRYNSKLAQRGTPALMKRLEVEIAGFPHIIRGYGNPLLSRQRPRAMTIPGFARRRTCESRPSPEAVPILEILLRITLCAQMIYIEEAHVL